MLLTSRNSSLLTRALLSNHRAWDTEAAREGMEPLAIAEQAKSSLSLVLRSLPTLGRSLDIQRSRSAAWEVDLRVTEGVSAISHGSKSRIAETQLLQEPEM